MAFNMNPKKNPMPSQDPNIRNKNFSEVALGYTEEMAIDEAKRCLNCKTPKCVSGCPVKINIPGFIKYVAEGNFLEAYNVISKSSSLPAVCGRVCPQENQCEGVCVRGVKGESVAIGRLERFVADWYRENKPQQVNKIKTNGHKVAIVGSGPSGLACAGDLAKLGYDVTIFEALHLAGGVLVYGIPEFRLPKSIVQDEIEGIKKLGVKVETNVVIGKTIEISELINEYGFEAVFVGSGAGLPKFMNIPGENLKGVYSANEFLTRVNLMHAQSPDTPTPLKVGKTTAIIGGGNVAMDAARTAVRVGYEKVYIFYRRTEKELPARLEEIRHAKEEGVDFQFLHAPIEINGVDGWVKSMKFEIMELGEPDASGRQKPVGTGKFVDIELDSVIVSLGTGPNPIIQRSANNENLDLETDNKGYIVINEKGETSIKDIYAGGDVAPLGPSTAINAMGAGKRAAKAIIEALS